MDQPKELCRLCYYETTDIIDIFSEKGNQIDLCGKIKKYLYLQTIDTDDLPNSICWMCSQHLETFDKFYSKINEIQRSRLKENYEKVALKAIYQTVCNPVEISTEESVSTFTEKDVAKQQVLEINISNLDLKEKNDTIILNQSDCLKETITNNIRPKRQKKCQKPVSNEIRTTKIRRTRVSMKKENDINIEEENNEKINVIVNENESNNKQNDEIINTSSKIYNDLVPEDIHKEIEDEIIVPDTINIVNDNNEILPDIVESKKELPQQNKILIDYDFPLKRRRGRPKVPSQKPITTASIENLDKSKSPIKKSVTVKTPRKKKDEAFKAIHCDIPMHDIDDIEGESNDEFPTRDSDEDDWPAQQTLDDFPKEIIKDGVLLFKGQRLMTLICRFYRLKCELCPKGSQPKFKILRELFLHHLHEHETIGYVQCCQTKFSRYPAIIMHMARHLQPDAFKCDECGYVVTRPRFLSTHKKTHLPEDLKPYGCDICSRRFCWKGALQVHMISHQAPEDRKQYHCPFCSKVYDTPGGLSTHKNLTHNKAKKKHSNICHICAKKFATRTGLNEHMTTIHQPRENSQLQCYICDKWLMNKRCLKSHMLLHSTIEFECLLCDYKTKKRELLKRHTVTQHSDLKPFKCHCGKSFKLKRGLTVHKNKHNETKTFQCPFCPKTFNSSTNFYSHRKNSHPFELEEMKRQLLEKQRKKRIKAGVEIATDIPLVEETVLYEIIIPTKKIKNKNSNSNNTHDDGNVDNDNAADKETYYMNVSISGDEDDDEEKYDNEDDDGDVDEEEEEDEDDNDDEKEIEVIQMNEEEEIDNFNDENSVQSSFSYKKQKAQIIDTSINNDNDYSDNDDDDDDDDDVADDSHQIENDLELSKLINENYESLTIVENGNSQEIIVNIQK